MKLTNNEQKEMNMLQNVEEKGIIIETEFTNLR